MEQWTANFVNNPNDDYNLIVEILFDDEDVAVIQQGKNGVEIKWYAHSNELTLPLNWFLGILTEAKRRIDRE